MGGGAANEYVFRQLIVKLSNDYINVLYCLVPNAKDKAKKSYQEKKKIAKKTSGCHFSSQNPSLVSVSKKKHKNIYIFRMD